MSQKPKSQRRRLPCGRPAPSPESPVANTPSGWRAKLTAYLAQGKFRNSSVRLKIAEIALSAGDHVTAQELTVRVKLRHPEIGMATVYRTLKLLSDAQILRESLSGQKEGGLYEPWEEGHHDHVVCLDCNEIFEFHDAKIEDAQEAVTSRMRFRPVRHQHVVYARCDYRKA